MVYWNYFELAMPRFLSLFVIIVCLPTPAAPSTAPSTRPGMSAAVASPRRDWARGGCTSSKKRRRRAVLLRTARSAGPGERVPGPPRGQKVGSVRGGVVQDRARAVVGDWAA